MTAALLLATAFFAHGLPAWAAIANPDPEDIDYVSEHLLESAQDDRFVTLPLPAGEGAVGTWEPVVTLGYGQTKGGFLKIGGTLFGLGLGYQKSDRLQLAAIGFFDSFDISGGSGRDGLIPLFSNEIPLDLPEDADFSHPRGSARHWGLGLAFTWRPPLRDGHRKPWTLTGGVMWNHLEARDFEIDYQVVGGASAGISGVLDHSADYSYISPFLRLRYTRPLGSRFALSPQLMAVVPFPRRGWVGRITGPGFDISGDTEKAGHGVHMGDACVGAGIELAHLRSHLAVDFGAMLWMPLYEPVINQGLDRSWLLQLVWRPSF